MDDNRLILGLDVSTTTIGISLALVDKDNNVIPVDVTHLRLKIDKNLDGAEALFVKNKLFLEKMKEYEKKYVINEIIIEDALISSNNSYTASTLLKFNGIVSWSVYQIFGKVPQYISSYDARKYGMPELMAVRKFKKNGEPVEEKAIVRALKKNDLVLFGSYPYDVGKKEVVWNFISEKFPEINWVTNKKGELTKENFDASDSLMCILGYVNKLKYESQEPVVSGFTTTDKGILYTTEFCGLRFYKSIERFTHVDEAESDI